MLAHLESKWFLNELISMSVYSAESFQQIPIGSGSDLVTQIDHWDLLVAQSAVLMHNRWMLVRSFRGYSSTRYPKPMKTRPTNSQSPELLPTVSAKTLTTSKLKFPHISILLEAFATYSLQRTDQLQSHSPDV